MRARAIFLCAALLLSLPAVSLTGQQRPSRFDGAWRQAGIHVVSPDSTYDRPGWPGLGILAGRHFSEVWVTSAERGVRHRPVTDDEKAARYDLVIANAGTFQASDTLLTFTYTQSKDPLLVGATVARRYRLRGDTLQLFVTQPWRNDSTKTVRTAFTFVRQR